MTEDAQSESRRALLAATLDTIVPAEEGFPAGGAIALDHVWRQLQGAGDVAALLASALDAIARAAQRFPGGLAGLPSTEREAVLRRVESGQPQPFAALVLQTFNGYYSHPAVVELLGLPREPPQPRGHLLEPGDLTMLERVRRRGPLYRPA